jgi:hypothetical protein
MKVEFNPSQIVSKQLSMKGQQNEVSSSTVDNSKVLEQEKIQGDTFEQKKHTSSLRNGFSNIWKFFSVTNKMVESTLKGLFYGALTGATLLSGSWLFKSLPNAVSKGTGLWNTIKHPLQNISRSGKIIAGVGSALVLGYHVVKGKLDANQKTAVIDHKLKTGHRDK